MAPLLIDSRDVLKLGFIAMLVITLTFFGGFLFGHQRAATFYQTSNDIQPLVLPATSSTRQGIVESQTPLIIEAGEEIDVDQPEIKKQAVTDSDNTSTAQVMVDASENKAMPEVEISSSAVITEVNKVEQKNESKENDLVAEIKSAKAVDKDDSSASVDESINLTDASIITAFTSDELRKIKYSIQVGVYGRLINAENMMKMLQAQQFDAYVTDYTNKKDEIRYNVRFGYFADKKLAISALDKFKTSQKGDGYLVRFSAENIVKVADAADIKQAVDVPSQNSNTDKVQMPATVPTGNAQDKISQADVLNDMPTATKLIEIN
ncbi:MAG: SPOR domain-containing protein [Proteobacteria bacterium]|nr:SPOR domain-containing protein [Pseudomonadota bacterium]